MSETIMSICLGIGLSAACGFRVFVPLFVASLAAHTGHLTLGTGFQWLASNPAMTAFGVATVAEIAAYYVPWVDHALDTVATPVAIVAGTLLTASLVTDMSPLFKWTLAVIAGGGAAGLVQGATVLARGASTATTGGFANPIFATIELGGSILTSAMAMVAPVFLVVAILVLAVLLGCKVFRKLTRPAGIRPVVS